MAVDAIDRRWTYYTFTNLRLRWILPWLTTWNVDVLKSIECELVGVQWILWWLTKRKRRCTAINKMWISRSEFKRFTDIYNTIRWTNNGVYSFTNTFNIITTRTDRITTYRKITNALTVTYRNRSDRRRTCMQWIRCSTNKSSTWKNSRLSIRLENITDWRGSIHALKVNTNFYQKLVD